jgi:hypothetical protein
MKPALPMKDSHDVFHFKLRSLAFELRGIMQIQQAIEMQPPRTIFTAAAKQDSITWLLSVSVSTQCPQGARVDFWKVVQHRSIRQLREILEFILPEALGLDESQDVVRVHNDQERRACGREMRKEYGDITVIDKSVSRSDGDTKDGW